MKKQRLFFLFGLLFFFAISYGAEITVPSGDTIENYIEAAADGDVLILENGGVYVFDGISVSKSLTLKAEDGYTTRPIIYASDYFEWDEKSAAGVTMTQIGLEFISSDGSDYLNRVNKNGNLDFLGMYDCVVRGFTRNFIQAKDKPSELDSVIVEDCYVYGIGGENYELIYIDDALVSYFRLSNSSFVGFDESFIYSKSPTVKRIIVENCNIHGRTDNSNKYLFKLTGAEPGSSFILKNSIISNIKLDRIWSIDDNITDTVMNTFYYNIDSVNYIDSTTWSYESAFTETDPMFSNGPAGALYLTAGSPALTASTTGGFIGASRWTVLPPATTMLNLTVNGNPSVLSPAFHTDTLNYTGDVPFAFGDTITVEALPVFAGIPITGTGKHAWDGTLELSIDVVVDGAKTYHIDLSRIPPNEDPTLKRIVIRDTANTDYIFFPPDQPDLTEFDLRFPAGNPTLYMIKTDRNFSGTDVSVTDTLDVSSGSGEWLIYCTAESGATVTYTINARTVGTGTVTTLRKLMLSSPVDTFATTPPFQSGISNYTLEVPAGTDTVYVESVSTDSYATIAGDTMVIVSSGSGTASVTVTSEDGSNNQTYTVDITVAGVGIENDLASNILLHHNTAIEQLLIFNAGDVKQVEIYSITGKLLINKSVANENTLEISTNELSNGIYLVRLSSSDKVVHATKFIK